MKLDWTRIALDDDVAARAQISYGSVLETAGNLDVASNIFIGFYFIILLRKSTPNIPKSCHSFNVSPETTAHSAFQPDIAIGGGGIGGLVLARVLQTRGVACTVYEAETGRDVPAASLFYVLGGTLDMHPESGLRMLRDADLWDEF
ncbi:hypothetical protein FISHEDRAFT_71419 [Fistulina hepatica ATCC 64428]|nr:hypothetical protein FISHEDRAFT_71419 [Fistulina hepatica ATCC 64428]